MKRRQFLASVGASVAGVSALASEPVSTALLNNVYEPYTNLTSSEQGVPHWINNTPVIGRIDHVEGNTVKITLSSEQKVHADFVLTKQRYPVGGVIADEVLEGVKLQKGETITKPIQFEGGGRIPEKHCFMLYSYDTSNNPVYICESGPLASVEGEIMRVQSVHRRPSTPDELSFSRDTYNGGYEVSHQFQTDNIEYYLNSWVGKASYEAAVNRNRNVISMYEEALRNPHAERLAKMFWQMPAHSKTTGPVGTHERETQNAPERPEAIVFKQVVDFVQQMNYEKDYFSKESIEYARTVEEVLVDGEGDCEDVTCLLAGILSSDPFSYETAFLATQYHTQPLFRLDDIPVEKLSELGLIENPVEDWDTFKIKGDVFVPIETTAPIPIGKAKNLPVRGIYKDSQWFKGDMSAVTTSIAKNFVNRVELKWLP